VRFVRRALLALGVTGLIATVLRIRGTGGVPPRDGGWRELTGPDLGDPGAGPLDGHGA
jgi:hypothetical protein